MLFKTKKEAMQCAAKPYVKEGYLTIMENKEHEECVKQWFEIRNEDDELDETLIFEDGQWAILISDFDVNDPKSFWESPEMHYITEEEAEMYCAKQYWHIKCNHAKLESDNWTFKEYLTLEQLEARNAVLKAISKKFF